MYAYTFRVLQLFVVACFAFYVTLIFAGNLMDYNSNYQFVKHVFAMDTTFPDNKLMWRSITNETAVNVAYWSIIATEGVIALLGWIASAKMLRKLKQSAELFDKAKVPGFYAFMLAIALWFVGFLCIGSEWFAMWQSSQWNGKQTAMDIVQIIGVFLIIFIVPIKALQTYVGKK